MSYQLMLLFSATVFVASILPGPSMLLALTHGIHHGAKRTIASALGNVTVTVLQASVSIAGLGAILLASESAFQVIKWIGSAYLVYTGICMLRSSTMPISPGKANHRPGWNSFRKMYLQGAFVTAGNPKAIVFFTAVFPQFINPSALIFHNFVHWSACWLVLRSTASCFMQSAGKRWFPCFPGPQSGNTSTE